MSMHWEGLKSRFEKFRNDELVVNGYDIILL